MNIARFDPQCLPSSLDNWKPITRIIYVCALRLSPFLCSRKVPKVKNTTMRAAWHCTIALGWANNSFLPSAHLVPRPRGRSHLIFCLLLRWSIFHWYALENAGFYSGLFWQQDCRSSPFWLHSAYLAHCNTILSIQRWLEFSGKIRHWRWAACPSSLSKDQEPV